MNNEKIAVYAGSFDPPTNGHIWMIEQGSRIFDKLVVSIGINPEKHYTFSVEERLNMLRESLKDCENVEFSDYSNQFLINYAKKIGADFILRGTRNSDDDRYERSMNNINREIDPNITTVILPAPKELSETSSSMVKGFVGPDGWEEIVCQYVPKPVFDKLKENYDKESNKKILRFKWNDLCHKLDIPDAQHAFNGITNHYLELHRSYHNLNHLINCFNEFDSVKSLLQNPDAVELAIWYHDIIHTNGKKNNETESVRLAQEFCQDMNLDQKFTNQVVENIMATTHTAPVVSQDAKYITDIDMAILGQSSDVFDKYEEQIYQEYSSFYTKSEYQNGRKEFLKKLLEQPIFLTEFFKNKYEQLAKENIQRDIDKL